MARSAAPRGFTLLEVLVAISILGLGLTAILSAQAGLFASSAYGERASVAVGLVRCKLSELELKLTKDGYPLTDVKDEGACCGDEAYGGFKCRWTVEKVELPQPPTGTDLASKTGPGALSGMGPLGAIAAVGQSNGAILGGGTQLGDVSKLLSGQTPISGVSGPGMGAGLSGTDTTMNAPLGGTDPFASPTSALAGSPGSPPGGGLGSMGGGMAGGMSAASSLAPLVMSLVYPGLKPMLEASIRKLVVHVDWKAGGKKRELMVTEFVTSPQQGGLDPNAAQGMDAAFANLANVATSIMGSGGTPTPASPTR